MLDDPQKIITFISIVITIICVYLGYRLGKYARAKDDSKVDTPLSQLFSKRMSIIIFGIMPIFIALVFVILYNKLSEIKFTDFIIYGIASAGLNLIIMFVIFYIYKEKFLAQLGGSYVIAIFYIFTTIFPFFIYFVLVSLVFSGWQIPFEF